MTLTQKTLRFYNHTCKLCGVSFTSESACSKFCKPAHKQRYIRWRYHLPALVDKMTGSTDDPEGYIQQIGTYLDFPDMRDEAIKALNAINWEINNQLQLHNIRRVK